MTRAAAQPAALVIGPAFFGYEKDIVAEFERQGYAATFVDERPTNSAIGRAVMRVRRELVGRKIASYYRGHQAMLTGRRFDIILVIKAEITPRWFLEWLRSANPNAQLVFYNWDAISYNPNCLQVLDLFDRRLSFDREDVGRRTDLEYLPLFYTPDFAPRPSNTARERRAHVMAFVGTLRPGRYTLVRNLFADRPATFGFFFVQARWYFAVRKYITREHPGIRWADVAFAPMRRPALSELFRNSHAVVDMPAPGQVGLTIRTFEVLASGALLITTNAAILHEPFYDPERVILLGEDFAPHEIDDLWARLDATPPPGGPPDGFERYSLSSWVRTVAATDTASQDERPRTTT
jgi:hypothetical protein